MGIQISEEKLSPKAQAALRNAKSKSQFLRDAIEFYVGRDIAQLSEISELVEEIKALRKMLSDIAASQASSVLISEIDATRNADVLKSKVSEESIITDKSQSTDTKTSIKNSKDKPGDKELSLDEKEQEAIRLLDSSIENFLGI